MLTKTELQIHLIKTTQLRNEALKQLQYLNDEINEIEEEIRILGLKNQLRPAKEVAKYLISISEDQTPMDIDLMLVFSWIKYYKRTGNMLFSEPFILLTQQIGVKYWRNELGLFIPSRIVVKFEADCYLLGEDAMAICHEVVEENRELTLRAKANLSQNLKSYQKYSEILKNRKPIPYTTKQPDLEVPFEDVIILDCR